MLCGLLASRQSLNIRPCPPPATHSSKQSSACPGEPVRRPGRPSWTPPPFYVFPFSVMPSLSHRERVSVSLHAWSSVGRTEVLDRAVFERASQSLATSQLISAPLDRVCCSSRALFRGTELLDLGNAGKSSRLMFGPKFFVNSSAASSRCRPGRRSEHKKPMELPHSGEDAPRRRGNETNKCSIQANSLTTERKRTRQSPSLVLNSKRAKRRRVSTLPGKNKGLR